MCECEGCVNGEMCWGPLATKTLPGDQPLIEIRKARARDRSPKPAERVKPSKMRQPAPLCRAGCGNPCLRDAHYRYNRTCGARACVAVMVNIGREKGLASRRKAGD